MRPTRTLAEIDRIILHHQGPGSRALTVAEVDALHRTPDHFGPGVVPRNPGPQYHLILHQEGGPWVVQQVQPLTAILMHAPGANTRGLAVLVLCGDLDVLPLPPALRELLLGLLRSLLIDPSLPSLALPWQVMGHGEVTPARACPGVHMDMAGIRAALSTPAPVPTPGDL